MSLKRSKIKTQEKVAQDVSCKYVSYDRELENIQKIRRTVFQEEQGVDAALEFDGRDDRADHLLAYLGEEAVGTARIRKLDSRTVKIERLAVLPVARRQGIGRKLMEMALERACVLMGRKNETMIAKSKTFQGS